MAFSLTLGFAGFGVILAFSVLAIRYRLKTHSKRAMTAASKPSAGSTSAARVRQTTIRYYFMLNEGEDEDACSCESLVGSGVIVLLSQCSYYRCTAASGAEVIGRREKKG